MNPSKWLEHPLSSMVVLMVFAEISMTRYTLSVGFDPFLTWILVALMTVCCGAILASAYALGDARFEEEMREETYRKILRFGPSMRWFCTAMSIGCWTWEVEPARSVGGVIMGMIVLIYTGPELRARQLKRQAVPAG